MKNTNSIRILQLGSPTGLYGAERWILALLRHLDSNKIESIVSVIKDEPGLKLPLCEKASSAGFPTHVFKAYGKLNLSAVRHLRGYLLQKRVDILHTHGYKTDLIGLLASVGTDCRIVSTPHGWSNNAGIKLQVYEKIDRTVFPLFDAVAPLSEGIYLELARLPGLKSKLHLIRNGVDISEIDAENTIVPTIRQWKAEGRFVCGYIGQLIPRKGLEILLEAFARLQVPGTKLAIIGEGEQRQQLEHMSVSLGIAKDVKFFGFRDNRLSFLRGFDAFVLPSSLEGVPRCLMEAMAAGVLVVASNISGCRDIVSNCKTGYLFKVDDIESLCHVLKRAISDKETSKKLVNNARLLINNDFSAKRMANEYTSLYERLRS